ncbi:MAG: amidohydrolase family protein [Candidatus Binatia bacterium]
MRFGRGFPGVCSTVVLAVAAVLASASGARAQSSKVAAMLGYPETIVHNAKIVTVDDHSFESKVGTVAKAMAVRDGKILALGTDEDIKALAGPKTKVINLGGRTVVPGFIAVHNHPMDWAPVVPEIIDDVLPPEILINRNLTGTPKDQLAQFPAVLKEMAAKAKPGAWIQIIFVWDFSVDPLDPNLDFWNVVTKEQLDREVPNNPIIVRSREILQRTGRNSVLNQKAIDETKRLAPPDFLKDLRFDRLEKTGIGDLIYRLIWPQVILRDRPDLFTEMVRRDLEWWAAEGQTSFGTFLYHYPNVLKAFRTLDQRGQMASRLGWGYGMMPDPSWDRLGEDPFVVMDLATRVGEGSDSMWYMGTAAEGQPGSCLSLQPLNGRNPKDPDLLLQGGGCGVPFKPGTTAWNLLKNGSRLMAGHIFGDVAIDNLLTLVEQASKDGGISPEDVKAKRHIIGDHMNGWPRPDQIPRMKNIGAVAGGTNIYILDGHIWLKDYGEKALDMNVPRASLFENGVMNGIEVDKPLELTDQTLFEYLNFAITRKAKNGRVFPKQKLTREQALKAATIFGAYYLMKENKLGSLEAGKLADFLVLNNDYMTVPEADIDKIKPLMSVVGGKVVHLTPELAAELKMEPAGDMVLSQLRKAPKK